MPGEETPTPAPTPSLMDAPPAADPTPEEKPDGDVPAAGEPADGVAGDAGDPADGAAGDGGDGDGKGPEGGEEEGEKGDGDGVPEEYADFTVDEGIELDPEVLEAFKPVAKELGLSQENAQKLVDLQTQTAKRWQEAIQQHVVDTRLGWREAAQKDPEIGGEKFAENLAIAKAGRDAFGVDEELKTLLDETGLGDHPAVIRHFYKVGKANSEHDFVSSGKPEKSKSFYDHPTSKK